MDTYPIMIKTQIQGSLAITCRIINNDHDLQKGLYNVRNFAVRNIHGDLLPFNWWVIRVSDNVVLAQNRWQKL